MILPRELDIDPAGAKGITVIAADRMGVLCGRGAEAKVSAWDGTWGAKKRPTGFVPAGHQRVYAGDALTEPAAPLAGAKLVGLVVVAGAIGEGLRMAEDVLGNDARDVLYDVLREVKRGMSSVVALVAEPQ